MDLLVNDLSIHGQLRDIPSIHGAFARLMAMRKVARRFDREVYCGREFLIAEPAPNMTMMQALQRLDTNRRRSAMLWLRRHGPFWDDLRRHDPDDWLECRGDIVTDTAVGEAAFRCLHGVECGLVSARPSEWEYSPVTVAWRRDDPALEERITDVDNWLDPAALEKGLYDAAPPIRTWDDLRNVSLVRFEWLTFADDCFEHLEGIPFATSSADRILVLLENLDRLASAFDATGARTPEGHRIYENYFKGGNALFSDSSDAEKRKFRNRLTFPHPDDRGTPIFCPWHGKERHLTLRLHFSWSFGSRDPVYVVYVGPKLTKR